MEKSVEFMRPTQTWQDSVTGSGDLLYKKGLSIFSIFNVAVI
jgi:hypothetical protein